MAAHDLVERVYKAICDSYHVPMLPPGDPGREEIGSYYRVAVTAVEAITAEAGLSKHYYKPPVGLCVIEGCGRMPSDPIHISRREHLEAQRGQ